MGVTNERRRKQRLKGPFEGQLVGRLGRIGLSH